MVEAWTPSTLPFTTNYNDHFETPLQAYLDVKPLLDWLSTLPEFNKNSTTASVRGNILISSSELSDTPWSGNPLAPQSGVSQTKLKLYDPYYCNGRTALFLKQLGYENVVHEKRDFYIDIARNDVPCHDVLITNPPYSDTHKIQCLDFCSGQGTAGTGNAVRKPFLLLMPAYTASKQYYRDSLGASLADVVYLVPSVSYKYDHPDSTGKQQSPFESMWFCGIGRERIDSFQQYWECLPKIKNRPKLATSQIQLKAIDVISSKNRPNPKQRNRARRQLVVTKYDSDSAEGQSMKSVTTTTKDKLSDENKNRDPMPTGKRKRRRF